MLPSTISWLRRHQEGEDNIIQDGDEEGEEGESFRGSSHDEQITAKATISRIQKHDRLLAKDCVWRGVLRHSPPRSAWWSSHESSSTTTTTGTQPLQVSSLSLSSSSSSLSFEKDEEQEVEESRCDKKLLEQACEIMISSIHDDDFTPPSIQKQVDTEPSESLDEDKAKKYRQDLLTDDLRMFQEQLQLSRFRSNRTPSSSIHDRKLRLYQGRR